MKTFGRMKTQEHFSTDLQNGIRGAFAPRVGFMTEVAVRTACSASEFPVSDAKRQRLDGRKGALAAWSTGEQRNSPQLEQNGHILAGFAALDQLLGMIHLLTE